MTEGQVYAARRNPATPINSSTLHNSPDWYLDFAYSEVRALAAAGKLGDERTLVVRTGLDTALQAKAESIIETTLRDKAPAYRAHQAATVIATTDGLVRAMVGGRDYGESQFNRATEAARQPGSSFSRRRNPARPRPGLRKCTEPSTRREGARRLDFEPSPRAYRPPHGERRRVADFIKVSEMNNIMTHVVTEGTGRAAQIPGLAISGKTGTTNNSTNAWFNAFTGNLVGSVWFGNDENTPMEMPARASRADMGPGIFETEARRNKTAPSVAVLFRPRPNLC